MADEQDLQERTEIELLFVELFHGFKGLHSEPQVARESEEAYQDV